MSFIETYGKEIVALLVPFITWVLNNALRAKAKLFLASPHNFTFLVQQPWTNPQGVAVPTQTLMTASIMVWNGGKETATKVEWVFNWKPQCINIWPSRHYEDHLEPDGRYVMVFDTLAPNETLGCELLALNAETPNLITARCDQCVAQTVNTYPMRVIPNWQRRLLGLLLLAGLAAIVYATIALLQLLILRTPVI